MKKTSLLLTLWFVFAALISGAQITNGGFESWTATNPDGWVGSKTATTGLTITKVTTGTHGGANACGLKNTTTSHKRFTSIPTTVTNGTSYEISFWVKGTGQVRTGMFTGINTGTSGYLAYNDYVSATASWTQITQTLVADGDVSVAEFIISIGTMADVVIDDVAVTTGSATPQANIVTFTFTEQASPAVINTSAATVAIQVVNGTALTALVPTITVSPGATITPASGVAQDFTTAKVYTVKASDNSTKDWTVTVTVASPVTLVSIYDIQYTTNASGDSPKKDQAVSTSGIVTASFASGYFIQNGVSPWNGLYIFDNVNKPVLGDSITVTGTVTEYYNYTELKTITSYIVNAQGKPLPQPIELPISSVKNEQYEGMLVKITNAKCTYVHSSGWWKMAQGTDTLEVGKLIFPYPGATKDKYYDVVGLVNYSFFQFTVEPRSAADIQIRSGIDEISEINKSVYPNPVNSKLYIDGLKDVSDIEITDISGKVLLSKKNQDASASIDMSTFADGVYFVRFMNDSFVLSAKTIIKR